MTRQTLRDWVHRYNADGVEGLRSRTGPGRPPFLTEARMEELREIVLKGPDPERHAVIRWRCAELCEEITERWSVKVCDTDHGQVVAPAENDPAAASPLSSEEGSRSGSGF